MTSQIHPTWEEYSPKGGQQQQPMGGQQQGMSGQRQGTSGQQQGTMGGQQSQAMGGQQSQPMGGQQSQTMGSSGGQLPQEYRTALHSVAQAIQVCGWCADQCTQMADPHMVECIRLCEDVVELGETTLALAPRSSRFTGEIVSAFQQAAQACAQECGQHAESHCRECATVLDKAVTDCQQLASMGGGTAGMTQQMGGTGDMGGQQF